MDIVVIRPEDILLLELLMLELEPQPSNQAHTPLQLMLDSQSPQPLNKPLTPVDGNKLEVLLSPEPVRLELLGKILIF
jgi:predicted MPP superfamily phosphohydrolase